MSCRWLICCVDKVPIAESQRSFLYQHCFSASASEVFVFWGGFSEPFVFCTRLVQLHNFRVPALVQLHNCSYQHWFSFRGVCFFVPSFLSHSFFVPDWFSFAIFAPVMNKVVWVNSFAPTTNTSNHQQPTVHSTAHLMTVYVGCLYWSSSTNHQPIIINRSSTTNHQQSIINNQSSTNHQQSIIHNQRINQS